MQNLITDCMQKICDREAICSTLKRERICLTQRAWSSPPHRILAYRLECFTVTNVAQVVLLLWQATL